MTKAIGDKEWAISYVFTGFGIGFGLSYFAYKKCAKNNLSNNKRVFLPLAASMILALALKKDAPHISKGIFLGAVGLASLALLRNNTKVI